MDYFDKYGLYILGGLISLVAWFSNRLVKGIERRVAILEVRQESDYKEIDKRLDRLTSAVSELKGMQESNTKLIFESVSRIEKSIDLFNHRFVEYDKNIADFWKNYGGKL